MDLPCKECILLPTCIGKKIIELVPDCDMLFHFYEYPHRQLKLSLGSKLVKQDEVTFKFDDIPIYSKHKVKTKTMDSLEVGIGK